MAGGMGWNRAAHLVAAKERQGRRHGERRGSGSGQKKIKPPSISSPRTHSLQLCPTSLVFTTFQSPLKLWIHQWVNLCMRLAFSWSNYPPKALPLDTATLGTKPLIHELREVHLDLNHNMLSCKFNSNYFLGASSPNTATLGVLTSKYELADICGHKPAVCNTEHAELTGLKTGSLKKQTGTHSLLHRMNIFSV